MSDEMKRNIEVLKQDVRNIVVAVSRVEGQMNGLEMRLRDDISKGFSDVLSKLDGFAGEALASRNQRALQDASFNLLNEHMHDHEARLVRLERQEKKS